MPELVGTVSSDEVVELAAAVTSEAVSEALLDASPSADAVGVVDCSGASVVDGEGESSVRQQKFKNGG